VDLKLNNKQTALNIYYADILNDAKTDVIEANLLAIILKNIEAVKHDTGSEKIGGLAELLNHDISKLELKVEDVAFTSGSKTFTARIYINNTNYYLGNGKDCITNVTGRYYEIPVKILDQRLTVKYTSLTNTTADIVLYSGSTPTYASDAVTYYIYKYVEGHEDYSYYAANETAVRTKVMTKDNYSTGRYYVNFEYIPNDTYRVFAVASGYTIID